MKQGLEVEPTPVEGVEEIEPAPGVKINVAKHVLYISHVDYATLLWLVAKGVKNLVAYNRGNTSYLKSTKVLRSAFFDEFGLLRVRTLPIVLSQTTYILRRLSQEGLVEKVDSYYALNRKSPLWSIAKNSASKEIMDFLWELTMEG
jgi:hypothetical protein